MISSSAKDFTFIVQFDGSEYSTDCIATSQEFVYFGRNLYFRSSQLRNSLMILHYQLSRQEI